MLQEYYNNMIFIALLTWLITRSSLPSRKLSAY